MEITPELQAKRQPTEIWTRVMGYHRPVSQFNVGKKSEYHSRLYFEEPTIPCHEEETDGIIDMDIS